MMKAWHFWIRLAAVILMAGCVTRAGAEETGWSDRFAFSGWIEAVQSMRVASPHEPLTSRQWGRLKLSADLGDFFGFVSVDAEKNWEITDETGIDLQEAWLEYAADGWDVRIGRQTIIWGKADGVQITDIISPPDYIEYVTRDLDEIRMPVDAAKFRLLGEHIDTELIWIPVFKAAVQPSGDNPWALQSDLPEDVQLSSASTLTPSTSLENSEIALKVSAFFSGMDAAASVFYTWDDYPTRHRRIQSDGKKILVCLTPEYHRLTVFGLEFSRPWSEFVFRGEAAYYKGRYYETKGIADNPLKKDAVKWLFGIDWSPGHDWTVIAQLTGITIFDYEPALSDSEHSPMVTLNVSKKLRRQTLTLSNMLYYRMDDDSVFDRLKAEYALTDSLHLLAGADIFYGQDDATFGRYQNNTQVWIKARYSF